MIRNSHLEAGLLDNPNDVSAARVYADWLEEHGDPERGALYRHGVSEYTCWFATQVMAAVGVYDVSVLNRYEFNSVAGDNSFTMQYGQMYSAGGLNLGLAELTKLSEFFGTIKINVDGYSEAGCESCDHGSSYGHDVRIIEAVRWLDAIDFCRNQDLMKFFENRVLQRRRF